MIRLTASDFYTLFRPTRCENRVYLRQLGVEEAPSSPYDEVLLRLGEKHETAHLSSFPEFVDLRGGSLIEREQKTKEEINKGCPVIYQGVLRTSCTIGGSECEVVGEPDFLIRERENYLIRDSKISRRITEKDHPEIFLQLDLYGWLYENTFGKAPVNLQVHAGSGEIVGIPYQGGSSALGFLEEILRHKTPGSELYSPVGWTKCGECCFNSRCWSRAEASRDVALVAGIDQGLATTLRQSGVETIEDLLTKFDQETLSEVKRPWGKSTRKVGKSAPAILRMASAQASGKEFLIQQPEVPFHENYVMIDLEGLPPHLDELEKTYLWGLQVFGTKKGQFIPALAGFGEEGDREGWQSFLQNAKTIFAEYGDIPFVHWHHYERVRINLYLERYGDPDGIADRVKQNLLDLLPITQKSIALPLPSYSLKVVEKYVGFKRTLEEYGGSWAIAKYIEATETQDPVQRDAIMDQILAYNREDLEATWAVLKWLKSKAK